MYIFLYTFSLASFGFTLGAIQMLLILLQVYQDYYKFVLFYVSHFKLSDKLSELNFSHLACPF